MNNNYKITCKCIVCKQSYEVYKDTKYQKDLVARYEKYHGGYGTCSENCRTELAEKVKRRNEYYKFGSYIISIIIGLSVIHTISSGNYDSQNNCQPYPIGCD
jgi:predicted nucleic acid-binding Zn ribbon protein